MNERPFHYWLPQWLLSQIKQKECSSCCIPYDKLNIVSCGVKQSGENKGLFIEHTCKKCDNTERVNFYSESYVSIKDICYMMIKEYQSRKQMEISRDIREPGNGSEITSSEVSDFLEFLNGSSTHEEFMKHIGCKFYEDQKKKLKKKIKKTKNKKVKKNSSPKDQSPKSSNKKNES